MSTPQELKVTERDTTLTPRQLRAAGYTPATLSNGAGESQAIQVRTHEFTQFSLQGVSEFKLAGYVDCVAKVAQIQKHSVSQQPLAVQFVRSDAQSRNKTSKAKKAKPAEQPAAQSEAEAETVLSGA